MLVHIDGDGKVERRDDPVKGDSLQARFEAMRQRRIEAQKRVDAADQAQRKPKRPQQVRDALRAKFVAQVESYMGVPYSKKASGVEDAPLYLDCCNLIRRCLLDLKSEFGFKVGHWNRESCAWDCQPHAAMNRRAATAAMQLLTYACSIAHPSQSLTNMTHCLWSSRPPR